MTALGTTPLPPGLRQRVVDAAVAARPPGRSATAVADISPVEALGRAAGALDALLGSLTNEEWRRPVLRDLDAQQLVGHLLGVEQDVHRGLVGGAGDADALDHVAATDQVARAQSGRAPRETQDAWRTAVATTVSLIESSDPEVLDREIAIPSLRLPLRSLLVVRVFELWTHENDIRRAVGREPSAPDPACLQLMTDLAMALLPAGVARAGRNPSGHVVRMVLTGAGGGTWDVALGGAAAGTARIVADATSFCRLVANRMTPAELAADVTGDAGVADDVLAGAAALALD